MNKSSRPFAKPLRDIAGKIVGETFTRQGFASAELVTRWSGIVGVEIAAHSEPIKIQWTRPADGAVAEPGTLVLRVEGPAAIEIQHLELQRLDALEILPHALAPVGAVEQLVRDDGGDGEVLRLPLFQARQKTRMAFQNGDDGIGVEQKLHLK